MFPLLDQNGTLTAMSSNNAVTLDLLTESHKWYSEGANQDDVVERLRLRTVPPGYKIHSWTELRYTTVGFYSCTFIIAYM